MLQVGSIQKARVKREIETGYVLDVEGEDVLLHYNDTLADQHFSEDDEFPVFLYHDKNIQIVATSKLPRFTLGEFGWVNVLGRVPKLGVFVDIGTTKDVLVSVDHLPIFTDVWPVQGNQLYVKLALDKGGRLIAIPANEFEFQALHEVANDVDLNSPIEGLIYYTSREGAVMISIEGYRCFIHHTEREKEPRLGDICKGRVIEVKEDGTLNVSLLPLKHERIESDAELILAYLEKHDGRMSLNDRSEPELIRETFNLSKSAFKRALGSLMREKRITQDKEGTHLIEK